MSSIPARAATPAIPSVPPGRLEESMRNPIRSLAARIVLLVFVATVTSSLAVSWIAFRSLDGFLRERIDQRFPEIARRIAGELEHWYEARLREVGVFAESTILEQSLPALESRGPRDERARAEAERYLEYVIESFPHFERLVIARPDGRPLAQTGGGRPLPVERLSAVDLPTDEASISEAFALGGRPVQRISIPVRSPGDDAIAWLHASLPLDRLSAVLASRELGDSARIFLVDRDGRPLGSAGAPVVDGAAPPVPAPADARDGLSAAAHYEDARGIRVVGTRTSLPRLGFSLVVEQPYEEAFAPVVTSMSRVVALNLIIVLACGLGASRLARSIVQPLRALARAARRLSEGEREVVIEETRASDEIHLLTRTFNDMSRRLGRFARELEENHRAIESANRELVVKNEALSEMNVVLEQLSITDGLTKLHNHRYFQESMVQACKRSLRTGEPLGLLLVDIDFFKRWNDRLGHAGGDEILRRMARALEVSVRETDVLARYGGEEFAVLALDTDLEGAVALAEKIRGTVAATEFLTDVPSEREPLTVSIGVARLLTDRRQLFVDADAALYRAKANGRDCVMVAEEETPAVDDAAPAERPPA
jgi:diguanylate cyclase (GGDEF)-like protein